MPGWVARPHSSGQMANPARRASQALTRGQRSAEVTTLYTVAGQSDEEGRFKLVALGGLGEVGMNCLVLETEGRMLVIDCGVTFPDHEPGIDVIHPDFDYLLARPEAIE